MLNVKIYSLKMNGAQIKFLKKIYRLRGVAIVPAHPVFVDRFYDMIDKNVFEQGREGRTADHCCLCLLAVSDQSERDQNEEGYRAVAASSRILSRANKVSIMQLIPRSMCIIRRLQY